jgi:hypothetical protein
VWFEPPWKSAPKVLKFSKRPNPRHPKNQTTELRDKRKVLNQTRSFEIFFELPEIQISEKITRLENGRLASIGWKYPEEFLLVET